MEGLVLIATSKEHAAQLIADALGSIRYGLHLAKTDYSISAQVGTDGEVKFDVAILETANFVGLDTTDLTPGTTVQVLDKTPATTVTTTKSNAADVVELSDEYIDTAVVRRTQNTIGAVSTTTNGSQATANTTAHPRGLTTQTSSGLDKTTVDFTHGIA